MGGGLHVTGDLEVYYDDEEELSQEDEAAIQAAVDGVGASEAAGPRIPLNADALFENPALVQFFGGIQYVCYLREAIHSLKDATIRNTDKMDEDKLAARKQIMEVAAMLLTKRCEYELDLALAHLETYFEHMT